MCRRTEATHDTNGIGTGRSLGIVTMAATAMTDRSTHRRSRAPIGAGSIEGPTHRPGSTVGPAMAGPTAATSGVLTTAVIAMTAVTEVSEVVGMTGVVTASPHQPRPRRRPRYPPRRRASSQAARRRSSGRRTRCLWRQQS